MAKLTFVLEDGQDVVVPVAERVSVGRDDGNDVVVDDPRISARHAELVRSAEGRYEVSDLESKAGTFVNGDRVEKRRPIAGGDKIAFGPLIAVFDLEDIVPPGNGVSAPGKAGVKEKAAVKEKAVTRKGEKLAGLKKGDKDFRKEPRPEIVPRNWKKKEEAAPAPAAPPSVPEKKEETPAELFARLEAGQKAGLEKLEKDRMRLQGEVDALQKALRDWQDRAAKAQDAAHTEQRKLDEARKDLAVAQAEIKSAVAQEEHLQAQLREAANELSTKGARVEKLRAEEERMAHVTESLRDAESSHAQWIAAINGLSAQYDQKNSEVLRLAAAAESALREVESVAAHKDEALAHLKQLREERESSEAHLSGLRQQVAAFEARSQEVKMLADARSDQVKSAEKRLEQLERQRGQIEAKIKELSGVEERLEKAREQCLELESKQGLLGATLASLSVGKQRAEEELGDLNERIAALRTQHAEITTATGEARVARQGVEEALHRINAERETHEKDLVTKREELITEMMRLDEARAKRTEIEAQCEDLADTGRKLGEAKEALAAAVARQDALNAEIHDLEARRDARIVAVGDLVAEEKAAEGRNQVLREREAALQEEIKSLATAERGQRDRFEEIRRLTTEAETEFAALKEELARGAEAARRELADLELKLAPLRDWKQAMDQRYARLAALPEDSAEARELWREIESEKGNLKNVYASQLGETRGVSLQESVLKGIVANVEKKAQLSKGVLHAPPALSEEADTPGQRANVGTAGTGAMYSGTGQEMALKARVNRLRESVQREAMRLEFLRQERAREETRNRGGQGGESMMREQDRQLESKVRREEERFATLQRKLELAEVEEEKRREKIADMERKLAELRSDISDAERQRNDLRHQADLVQTELKNYESALERVKKLAE
jgi:chromosome segregation ATPase